MFRAGMEEFEAADQYLRDMCFGLPIWISKKVKKSGLLYLILVRKSYRAQHKSRGAELPGQVSWAGKLPVTLPHTSKELWVKRPGDL